MPILNRNSSGRALVSGLVLPLTLLSSTQCDRGVAEVSVPTTAPASAQEQPSSRNPVLHWSVVASRLMVDPGPVIDSRAFAILHTAMHDAVNGIDPRYAPYAAKLSSRGASLDAAVATAAHDVLLALSPSQRAQIDSEYTSALAAIPSGSPKTEGVKLGRESASAGLARRAGDQIPVGPWPPLTGPITEPVYVPNGKPGDYAFTPPFDAPPLGPIALFPGWGRLTPFAVDVKKYRLPGPDALTSAEYARDVNLVKSVGSLNSRTRTADQGETAKFWFEDFTVLVRIANTVVQQKRLDAWETARTLSLMHLAIVDAGIACLEAKYRYRYWRPFTAIRRASEDGNPATSPDTGWLPLLWTPPESSQLVFLIPPIPEYPSAAATVSAAAAEVLGSILGDNQRFEAESPFLPGVTRRFTSFTQAAEEAGMSRVYGGIHFLHAVKDGWELGRTVARDVSRLLPPVQR
jgi:hypothetical protein